MGFIETPYRTVTDGKVDMDNSHIKYYSAEAEDGHVVAQSNEPIDDEGNFINADRIKAREGTRSPRSRPALSRSSSTTMRTVRSWDRT